MSSEGNCHKCGSPLGIGGLPCVACELGVMDAGTSPLHKVDMARRTSLKPLIPPEEPDIPKPRTVLQYAIENDIPCAQLTIQQQVARILELEGEAALLREQLEILIAYEEVGAQEPIDRNTLGWKIFTNRCRVALSTTAGERGAAVIASAKAWREMMRNDSDPLYEEEENLINALDRLEDTP